MTARPRLRSEWGYLAAVAADIYARRAAAYPARVAAGKMTSAEADAAIPAIAAIAADWRAAAAGQPIAAGGGRPSVAARLATLRTARDRAAAIADKAAAAYRQLPRTAAMPEREDLLRDHAEGRTLSAPAATWIRAVDYAAAVAAMLWWEERRGGDLAVVCAINAGRKPDAQVVARAEVA